VNFRLRAAGYHGPDLFGPDALRLIAEASEGLTRRINIYADKTLLAAFAAGTHTVSADHARAAISDTQIVMTRRPSSRRTAVVAALGVAAGVALGFAGAHVAMKHEPAVTTANAATPAPAPAADRVPAAPAAPVEMASAPAPSGLQPASATIAVPAPIALPAATAPRSLEARFAAGQELVDGKQPGYSVQLMVPAAATTWSATSPRPRTR